MTSVTRRWAPLALAAAIVLALQLTAPRPAAAETIREIFDAANAQFWAQDYESAARGYHRIVEDFRIDNPEVYFNLGNAYARQDRLGSAVLYYKRALACAPGADTEAAVRANLERARRVLVARHRQRIEQNRMLFDESHGAWYAIFHALSADTLAVILLAFWLPLMAGLLLRRARDSRRLRRALKPTLWSLFALALLTGGLLTGNLASSSTVRLGVVIHPDVKLKVSHVADAPGVGLPEGLELRILEEPASAALAEGEAGDGESGGAVADEDWLRVQLSNGREGWVPRASVKEI